MDFCFHCRYSKNIKPNKLKIIIWTVSLHISTNVCEHIYGSKTCWRTSAFHYISKCFYKFIFSRTERLYSIIFFMLQISCSLYNLWMCGFPDILPILTSCTNLIRTRNWFLMSKWYFCCIFMFKHWSLLKTHLLTC